MGEVGLHEDWPIIWDEFGEEVLRVSVAAYFIKARPAHEEREWRSPITRGWRGMIELAVDKASISPSVARLPVKSTSLAEAEAPGQILDRGRGTGRETEAQRQAGRQAERQRHRDR